jgi:hypothetical protein
MNRMPARPSISAVGSVGLPLVMYPPWAMEIAYEKKAPRPLMVPRFPIVLY